MVFLVSDLETTHFDRIFYSLIVVGRDASGDNERVLYFPVDGVIISGRGGGEEAEKK